MFFFEIYQKPNKQKNKIKNNRFDLIHLRIDAQFSSTQFFKNICLNCYLTLTNQ